MYQNLGWREVDRTAMFLPHRDAVAERNREPLAVCMMQPASELSASAQGYPPKEGVSVHDSHIPTEKRFSVDAFGIVTGLEVFSRLLLLCRTDTFNPIRLRIDHVYFRSY